MSVTPLLAMVRKDLRLFLTDRRAVIMSFVAPIAIASFFGAVFPGDRDGGAARVKVAIVDQDRSAISRAIVAGASGDENFTVTEPPIDEMREAVRKGALSVGVIIPPGFGEAAGRALFARSARPDLTMWYDPSKNYELSLVRGILTEHVMQSVSREMFSGAGGQQVIDDVLKNLDASTMGPEQKVLLGTLLTSARALNQRTAAAGGGATAGFSMPYAVKAEAVTAGDRVAYNGYAHAFAGMGIQFLLFAAIDLGINVLLERQRGLWKRLRSAPISRFALLGGKAISGTIIATMTLLASFLFAIVIFGVKISGSLTGFFAVVLACAAMAACFGLLIASLGRTPGGSRGVASLSVLMMVMLGGAWVPTFVFPAWLQRLTVIVPTRWAVDGLDAMTWRGQGLSAAVMPTLVLLGFALLFGSVALSRFRWEEQ